MKKLIILIIVLLIATPCFADFAQTSLCKGLVGQWDLSKSSTQTGTTNLVTNGTFDADTDWSKGNGWAIGGGVATFTHGSGNGNLNQSNVLTENETYLLSYDVTADTFDGSFVIASTVVDPAINLSQDVGTHTQVFTVNVASATSLTLRCTGGTGGAISIDNVTVYDATGKVVDKTPYSNHGSRVGTTWATGRNGVSNNALDFNGSSDYIDLSSSGFITQRASDTVGSISFWVSSNTTSGDCAFGIGKGSDITNRFNFTNNSQKWNCTVSPSGNGAEMFLTSDDTFTVGQVYHVVVTQSNAGGETSAKMYVNGVLQADQESNEWFSSLSDVAYFYIGSLEYNGSNQFFWDGTIEDFRYYNRALTQAEVTALYGLGPNPTVVLP